MNQYLLISLTILFLIIILIIIKYKEVFYKIESFKRKKGFGGLCKKRCKGCKYGKNSKCNLLDRVCPNYGKKCERKFNKAYKHDTWGNYMNDRFNNLKNESFGSTGVNTWSNQSDHLNKIKEVRNNMITYKKHLQTRKELINATDGKNGKFNKRINECIEVLDFLKGCLNRTKRSVRMIIKYHKSPSSQEGFQQMNKTIDSLGSDKARLATYNQACHLSSSENIVNVLDLHLSSAISLRDTIAADIGLETFENRYPNRSQNNINDEQQSKNRSLTTISLLNKFEKELKEDFESVFENENQDKKDIIEGFQTANQVRDILIRNEKIFGSGNYLGLTNSGNNDNSFNTLNDEKLKPYMGDQYYLNREIKDSSPNIQNDEIPHNVRQRAISEFLPYTIRSCHGKWSSIDNNDDENRKLNNINYIDSVQKFVKEYKSPLYDKMVVDLTKGLGFWDKTKGTWVPKENSKNARKCNGIIDLSLIHI